MTVQVTVTLDPSAFGLIASPEAEAPRFTFELADSGDDLALCEVAFAIANSHPSELFCLAEHAPIVTAYRALRHRSLSVGDTVAIARGGIARRYRVATCGFEPYGEPDATICSESIARGGACLSCGAVWVDLGAAGRELGHRDDCAYWRETYIATVEALHLASLDGQ